MKKFSRMPRKNKGIALLLTSLFLFVGALLFSTNEWKSGRSFIHNLGQVDAQIFKVNAKYPNRDWHILNIPLKHIGITSLALASFGAYFILSSRPSE